MKLSFNHFKQLLKESITSVYDAYEDILCDVFDVDDISKITPKAYRQILNDYENKQLNDHDSSMLESAAKLVWKAANEAGYNIIAHHGSNKKFSEFKYGDIGFHLGTLEQAKIAGKSHLYGMHRNDDIVFYNIALHLHNPLVIENDPESWYPEDLFWGARFTINNYIKRIEHSGDSQEQLLEKAKIIINYDIQHQILDINQKSLSSMDISFLILYQFLKFNLKEILDARRRNNQKTMIINRIKSLGYDGIKYLNMYEVEDKTDTFDYSYIVLDANQIKNCEVISFKGGKVVPLDERFNSGTNNLYEGKI